MAPNVAEYRARVQMLVQEALELVADAEQRRSEVVEARLWALMLALGAVLMELFLLYRAVRPRLTTYHHDGHCWRLVEHVETEVGTRFGKVRFWRQVGRRVDAPKLARDFPVDRELGLCSSFTQGVVLWTTRLCAQVAFGCAQELFEQVHGWAPSTRSVLRMVDLAGTQAVRFVAQAPAPEDDGEVLVIEVDCKGAPMVTLLELKRRQQPHHKSRSKNQRHGRRKQRTQNPRSRRTSGKKSKNAKMAAVGVIYTLRRTPSGLEGPVNKQVHATFQSLERLFETLRAEADKRGARRKRVVLVADGQEHIWRLQEKYFPEAQCVADWWHMVEKLWEVSALVFGEATTESRAWVHVQSGRLRQGKVSAVLAELRRRLRETPKSGPGNKWRRKRLMQVTTHMAKNAGRMQYRTLREGDLPIGSGVVEGAVRNSVGVRLDGPGMRWSPARAEHVLRLRCLLINGQWQDFERFLHAQTALVLKAQPAPTVPHDAVRRAA